MNILQRIVKTKMTEVAALKQALNTDALRELAISTAYKPVSLAQSIRNHETAIIAEFKRCSPSKGEIKPMAQVSDVIPAYSEAGAAGISVLTDTPYFGGSLTDFITARSITATPLLRKEFIIDEYQIYQARACGADAILLIAAILDRQQISHFVNIAHGLGLEVLFETHSDSEIDMIHPEVDLVGVNSRDLTSFHTSLDVTRRLADRLPVHAVRIAESGIHSPADIVALKESGFDGFLIGEAFMSTPQPGETLKQFIDESK